jgi:hypothetical protein
MLLRCFPARPGIVDGTRKDAGCSNAFAVKRRKGAGSNRSSTTNQLDNQNNQRNDQQNVDVPRNHVESYEADQPKYKQNQEDCPKHCVFLLTTKVLLRCDLVRLQSSGLPYHQN